MTIKDIQERFISGNRIQIDKAMVPAGEWRMAMAEIQVLKDQYIWHLSEISQLQEQNTELDAKLAFYERVNSKSDQVVEEIMGLAFKMAGMVQHVKHAPDGKERRQQAVDELEQAITNLDNIASELQSTCDRQAIKLASHEAVMRQALEALLTVANPKAPAAIKLLEEQLK